MTGIGSTLVGVLLDTAICAVYVPGWVTPAAVVAEKVTTT